MSSKIASSYELAELKLSTIKKMSTAEQSTRKLNKLKQSDTLVAPIEKTDLPNHALNTSYFLCLLFVLLFFVS